MMPAFMKLITPQERQKVRASTLTNNLKEKNMVVEKLDYGR